MSNVSVHNSLSRTVRLEAFVRLGEILAHLPEATLSDCFRRAVAENPWFTSENVRHALLRIRALLRPAALQSWLKGYLLHDLVQTCRVGIITAGNVPLVGFHDLLCVLISGHAAYIKPSRRDQVLIQLVSDSLLRVCPDFRSYVCYPNRLSEVDALIATGSNETVPHFVRYFEHIPHIIRGSRSSCAVLFGSEPPEALQALGEDVFRYFGLGCRSVSKFYLPEGYDFSKLSSAWEPYVSLLQHSRYANHCLYHRGIQAASRTSFVDFEYVLLKEDTSLFSPVGILHYETYTSEKDLRSRLAEQRLHLQSVYSWKPEESNLPSEPFGSAQSPSLSTYADNIDTMNFLTNLPSS